MKLDGVMIGTDDVGNLTAFYRKLLGEPGWEGGGYTGWKAGDAWLMIGPHSEVKGPNEMPARAMWNFEVPDVHAEFDRIKGLGANVIAEPYQPGEAPEMWLATFEDPDGNYFQIASPMPEQM